MIDKFREEYFFLSNFYEVPVTYGGVTYQNNEAAFQAQKTTDSALKAKFASLDPKQAKSLGRKVPLRDDWDDIKCDIMYDICKAKFSQNPDLAQKLDATGGQELVEGNDWNDHFWGVCNGKGKNMLGIILMKIREESRKGE